MGRGCRAGPHPGPCPAPNPGYAGPWGWECSEPGPARLASCPAPAPHAADGFHPLPESTGPPSQAGSGVPDLSPCPLPPPGSWDPQGQELLLQNQQGTQRRTGLRGEASIRVWRKMLGDPLTLSWPYGQAPPLGYRESLSCPGREPWKVLQAQGGSLHVVGSEDTYRSRWCRRPTVPQHPRRGGTGLRAENRVRSGSAGQKPPYVLARSCKSSELRAGQRTRTSATQLGADRPSSTSSSRCGCEGHVPCGRLASVRSPRGLPLPHGKPT